MRNVKIILIIVIFTIIMFTGSGCCTIMSGSTQDITISSTPSGAKVTADNGTSIVTPGSITLNRKNKHTLVAELSGHEEQQQRLEKKLNNWVWGNILIGGIIGLVIDMVSGSVNELQPKEVHFKFMKPVSDNAGNIPFIYEYMLFEKYNYNRFLSSYKTAA